MAHDIPELRLGLGGFSAAQEQRALALARASGDSRVGWSVVPFAEADCWWLNGERAQVDSGGLLRVAPAAAGQRAIQLFLQDVERPYAFTRAPGMSGIPDALCFDLQLGSAQEMLRRFAAWLQPSLAQYALAASIVDNEPPLGAGGWEVLRGSELLAVVDIRQGTAVAPDACMADFTHASWCIRERGEIEMPDHFVRASLSNLMWQFALRTGRDLLPRRYRTKPLYFRRPPKIPQTLVRDAHLLLLRELAGQPGLTFDALAYRSGLAEPVLAHHLAALYLVGAITANPRRVPGLALARATAAAAANRDEGPSSSVLPSNLESCPPAALTPPRRPPDLTAPAPLSFE